MSAGKERSRPIAKRKRFKTRKAAKEAAERANKTKDPIVVHPAGGKEQTTTLSTKIKIRMTIFIFQRDFG